MGDWTAQERHFLHVRQENIADEFTLTANVAVAGGAIFNSDGSAVLQNTAVYQNHAFDVGGGVLKDGGTVVLISSSIMNNTPDNCFPIASIFGCYL